MSTPISHSSAYFCYIFLSSNFLSIISGWILYLSAYKKARQWTFDIFAVVVPGALTLSQVEKHVLVTYRADFQR